MKERIVLIDDNPNDVQLIRRVLERAGYEVSYASSGEEGLRLASEILPDCILVDYRMPGLNGYEVAGRIKADQHLRSVPVLMLTGADSSKNLVEGLASGADDYVTKASDIEVIVARVKALLRVKAYQDQIVAQSAQLRGLYDELSQKSERIMALNQQLNKDLEVARRVQEALLPPRQFVASHVEIRSTYIPSTTLSGDFYDYFLQGDNFYLFVADVSGHGLPAAIQVSLLKSYIHTETESSSSLSGLMERLNDFLFAATLPSQYATAQIFRLDGGRRLFYSNAAHPPFLLYRSNLRKASLHEQPGHLLGAMPALRFEEFALDVEPGDLLFTYTDGLTDQIAARGEFYPIERIAAILESSGERSLEEIDQQIAADLGAFSAKATYKDDIAFVLTRFV